MLKTSWKLYLIILFSLSSIGLLAQEGTPIVGERSMGTGGLASYSTIGQIVYNSNMGTSCSSKKVAQFEVYQSISTICLIYPNPTKDYITLRINKEFRNRYQGCLYDVYGKLLQNIDIVGNETSIDIRRFESGIYFLRIFYTNKQSQTFKVIKN